MFNPRQVRAVTHKHLCLSVCLPLPAHPPTHFTSLSPKTILLPFNHHLCFPQLFYQLPLHRAQKTQALPVCCHFTNTPFCLSLLGCQREKHGEQTFCVTSPPLTLFPLVLKECFMNPLCFITLCAFQFLYLKKKKEIKALKNRTCPCLLVTTTRQSSAVLPAPTAVLSRTRGESLHFRFYSVYCSWRVFMKEYGSCKTFS